MNLQTYTYESLKLISYSVKGFWVTLFCIGILPSICFATPEIEVDSVSASIENQITTKEGTKIFIVEGTITSNLEKNNSVEIVSNKVKREPSIKNSPNKKEKKKEPTLAKQEIKKEEPKKTIIKPISGKELLSLGTKNADGIGANQPTSKKLQVSFLSTNYSKFKVSQDKMIEIDFTKNQTTYLFFCKQTTRPPPNFYKI